MSIVGRRETCKLILLTIAGILLNGCQNSGGQKEGFRLPQENLLSDLLATHRYAEFGILAAEQALPRDNWARAILENSALRRVFEEIINRLSDENKQKFPVNNSDLKPYEIITQERQLTEAVGEELATAFSITCDGQDFPGLSQATEILRPPKGIFATKSFKFFPLIPPKDKNLFGTMLFLDYGFGWHDFYVLLNADKLTSNMQAAVIYFHEWSHYHFFEVILETARTLGVRITGEMIEQWRGLEQISEAWALWEQTNFCRGMLAIEPSSNENFLLSSGIYDPRMNDVFSRTVGISPTITPSINGWLSQSWLNYVAELTK